MAKQSWDAAVQSLKAHRIPSPPQIQALEDIARCGDPWARVVGMSKHGGWSSVIDVIERRAKWAKYSKRKRRWVLTTAGMNALRLAKRAKEVRAAKVAIVKRLPEPYVSVTMPGVLLVREQEMRASTLRHAIDRYLQQLGERRISIAIASLDPPDPKTATNPPETKRLIGRV